MSKGSEVAKYFCDKLNLKVTQKQFIVQTGLANALLKAGYKEEELRDIVDYLVGHPPKNGLSSLAYIQYVGNDILAKVKVKKMKESQNFFEDNPIDLWTKKDDENSKKYQQIKTEIKGLDKF